MRIVVMLEDGIVSDVLTDGGKRMDVEILDICDGYSDYPKLEEYRLRLYADPALRHVNHKVVSFETEQE